LPEPKTYVYRPDASHKGEHRKVERKNTHELRRRE
jgi:hypothetical protein